MAEDKFNSSYSPSSKHLSNILFIISSRRGSSFVTATDDSSKVCEAMSARVRDSAMRWALLLRTDAYCSTHLATTVAANSDSSVREKS